MRPPPPQGASLRILGAGQQGAPGGGGGHHMGSWTLENVLLSGLSLIIKMRASDFPACIRLSPEHLLHPDPASDHVP